MDNGVFGEIVDLTTITSTKLDHIPGKIPLKSFPQIIHEKRDRNDNRMCPRVQELSFIKPFDPGLSPSL